LGGWSEFIHLLPGVKVIKLPATLEPRNFMAAGCGLPTAIHAIQRAEIKLGDFVVIQGSGPVGLMAAVLSKISGAFTVVMIGAPEHRLNIAKEFGVDEVIDITKITNADDRIKMVLAATKNRGADITIEATGVPSAVTEGMRLTRDAGTYVIVGQYTNAGNIELNPHLDINKKHLVVKGCWGSDYSHFYLAVRFMEKFQYKYPWNKIITHEYTLDTAVDALNAVANLEVMKALINPNKH